MLIRPKTVIGAKSKGGTGPLYPGCVYDVEDVIGKRMCDEEVAEFVEISARPARAASIPSANPSEGENAPEGPKTAVYDDDAFLSENMTFAELKSFAEECGVYRSSMRSKAAIIEALKQAKVNDAFPDLTPQDVIDE